MIKKQSKLNIIKKVKIKKMIIKLLNKNMVMLNKYKRKKNSELLTLSKLKSALKPFLKNLPS